jgi:fructose-1,6-bisphosphatase II / sedoheptulose-1,7-bisphosphatase
MQYDQKLALIAKEATVKAAIASYSFIGLKNEKAADGAAVEAMRNYLNNCEISGRVVIGEGERDNAPMLYINEKLGKGGSNIDIAVDPLEGTTLLAYNKPGALSVIAFSNTGGFLHAPDIYMDKIVTHIDFDERIIDLENMPKENLKNIASAKKCSISDLIVTILNRQRHEELIARIREAGAKIKLIDDGDIAAAIGTSREFAISDLYMGIGGAPEGVLAAAALQNTKGQICAKLVFGNGIEKEYATKMGISDLSRQYFLDDLANIDSIFVATGITTGELLRGVSMERGEYITHSLVMHSGLIDMVKSKNNSAGVGSILR